MPGFFKKHFKSYGLISLAIIVILELFVFNYKAFLINPLNEDKYTEKTFSTSNLRITGLSGGEKKEALKSEVTVTADAGIPVKTIYLGLSTPEIEGDELTVDIDYSTDAHAKLRRSYKQAKIADDEPLTKYISCNYPARVRQIRLTFHTAAGTVISADNFSVNTRIPMRFSLFRVLFLWILGYLIFAVFKCPALGRPFDLKNKAQKQMFIFTTLSFMAFTVFLYIMYCGDINWWGLTQGNQLTQEIVDSFENGSASILEKVPEELTDLENPYDVSARNDLTVPYLWDHLLYDGKYYTYYGIAPVLTLFLPFHLITGYYFPSSLSCLIFTLLSELFLGMCLISIVRNWFPKTPFRVVLCGVIVTLFSSYAFINVMNPQFYEIAQSSALCFLTIGFYFMLNSGIFTENKIRLSRLCLSSLFVSLAVLSRATAALYAAVMVIWLFYGFRQYRNTRQGAGKHSVIKYIAAAALPYVFFAGVQMTYNFARFGNPLDFGLNYSLTIDDFVHCEPHLGLIMISLINYLFTIPVINSVFPFIHGNFDSLGINGAYYVATKPTFGLFASVLPLFAIFYAPKLAGRFDSEKKKRLGLIWLLPGVIIPVILIALTWNVGYSMRYQADFSWQLCFAAFVVIFYIFQKQKQKNKGSRKLLFNILFAATCWCVLCYTAAAFTSNPVNAVAHNTFGANIYYYLRNLVAFWN